MKILVLVITAAVAAMLTGCQQADPTVSADRTLLSVDFTEGQTLRYEFVSNRDIEINWGESRRGSETVTDNITQEMTMVVSYEPVEVQRYGDTTIKAKVESLDARSTGGRSFQRADAVETLRGKSWAFTIDPAGRLSDTDQLLGIAKEAAEEAFDKMGSGRVKDPDMTDDFLATQWFLWEAMSSVQQPSRGVAVGQNWQSNLFIPAPWIKRHAREVTYTLAELEETDRGEIAVIKEQYAAAEDLPSGWPMQYEGSFQMRGQFGFLRNYQMEDVSGQGRQIFNVTAGKLESHEQQYRAELISAMPMGLGVQPEITVNQEIKIRLLD